MNIFFIKENILANNDDLAVLKGAIADKMQCSAEDVDLSSDQNGQDYQLILTHSKRGDDESSMDCISIREDLLGAPLLYADRIDEAIDKSIFSMITSQDTNTKDLGLAIALRYQMSNHPDEQRAPAQIISPKLESLNHSGEYFKLYKILANSYFQKGILEYLDEITDNEPEDSLRYRYCMWAVGMPF